MFWERKLKRNLLLQVRLKTILQVRLKTKLNWLFRLLRVPSLELHGKPFID